MDLPWQVPEQVLEEGATIHEVCVMAEATDFPVLHTLAKSTAAVAGCPLPPGQNGPYSGERPQ